MMDAVSIVSATDAGLCESSRWYCSCNIHNTLLGVSSMRAAKSAAREPASWCEECRESETDDPSDDPMFGTLARCRQHREEVRAVHPGRYLIVKVPKYSGAYRFGVRFGLVAEDERNDYESGGAVFVDMDEAGT